MEISKNAVFDELEIRIFKETRTKYRADLLLPDGSRVSSRLSGNPQELLSGITDPYDYGRQLYDWLFVDNLGEAFIKTAQMAFSPKRSGVSDIAMRIRLWLDPESRDLHVINWEALCEPSKLAPISMQSAFSRSLRVSIPQHPRWFNWALRMVVITANPKDMPLIDISNTLGYLDKTVRSGYLRFIDRLELMMITEPSTLKNLVQSVGEDVRILHLFAQSRFLDGERFMILENEEGTAEMVPYEKVAKLMISAQDRLPNFVFISAPLPPNQLRTGLDDFLGPALVNHGVQSVVTIEAAMNAKDLNQFTIEFYRVLSRTGVVDEAVARARASIQAAGWDWSAPVLYTRTTGDIQIFQQIGTVEGQITGINISEFGG